jgi:hypothetical protein
LETGESRSRLSGDTAKATKALAAYPPSAAPVIIGKVPVMGFFSWLYGEKPKHGGSPAQASRRPAWAAAIPVSSEPIRLCSALTPQNMVGESPRQQQPAEAPAVGTAAPAEGVLQPVAGADNAVPWPMPCPPGAHLLTFWGTGSAHSGEFALPSDGALRIVARGGPIEVRVRRKDGSFLADRASLDGERARLGLLAIPRSGTYSLVVEAEAGLDWGVTVVYRGAAPGNPPADVMPTAKVLAGSPPPSDVFQPHMPSVHLLADMEAFFAKVRRDLALGFPQAPGQRGVAIITPTREVLVQTCPPPERMPPDVINSVGQLLPPSPPATICVISHTAACRTTEEMSKCIPFSGYLCALASIGHSVVVFEGHPSAFESGVRNCDVLFIDSGMLPFVQSNWEQVACRIMRINKKIFVHDRPSYRLLSRR